MVVSSDTYTTELTVLERLVKQFFGQELQRSCCVDWLIGFDSHIKGSPYN